MTTTKDREERLAVPLRYFGTDGIRDIANRGALSPEMALKIGRALKLLLRNVRRPRVAIATDTRVSHSMLKGALVAGMTSVGIDVLDIGIMPTPALSLLVPELHADLGIVVSASHNPMADNGIKLFSQTGEKLAEEDERTIEQFLDKANDDLPRPVAGEVGRVIVPGDALERYVELITSSLRERGGTLSGLRVALDCANGAASLSAPRAFAALGAQLTIIANAPDGNNINENCGSMHTENLQALVRKGGFHLGAAFDGDADRCLLVDERGQLVDGDRMLTILALERSSRHALPGRTVVSTVMSNLGLELVLKKHDMHLVRTAVGDKYVQSALKAGGFTLGGEQSGHIVLPIRGRLIGDGTLTALEIASLLVHGEKLSTLAALMPSLPQKLINIKVARKPPLETVPGLSERVKGWEQRLGSEGRVLLRYSGTETLARVMVEGSDAALVEASASDLANFIKGALGS
jgi:phosphoglucosamine mutase